MTKENLLIVGLGLIGRQRLEACIEFGIKPENIYVFDSNSEQASLLREAKYSGLNFVDSFESALSISFKRAIVAVPHDAAVGMVSALLDTGCRVILEKPMGRNIKEAQHLAFHKNSKNLSVGFNYRFMPGIIHLRNQLASGSLGKISSIKMELGHGGAPADVTSWKLNPIMAGGGVLLGEDLHPLAALQSLVEGFHRAQQMFGLLTCGPLIVHTAQKFLLRKSIDILSILRVGAAEFLYDFCFNHFTIG
jgi:predicted dehydrogenase